LIGGAYPLKSIDWELVKKAIQKNPDIDPQTLSVCGSKWSAHFAPGKVTLPAEKFVPAEVLEIATGFMLIKREVFEKLGPLSDHYIDSVDRKTKADFFEVGVYQPKNLPSEPRYESEDYSLCRRWREIGGKVWLCPWIKLGHQGTYLFPGDMVSALRALGEAH